MELISGTFNDPDLNKMLEKIAKNKERPVKKYIVYQDSIGNEEFKTLEEAAKYIMDTIQSCFSLTEIKAGVNTVKEIPYKIECQVNLKKEHVR